MADQDEDQGVTLVLSPVQLAAVLTGGSVDSGHKWLYRGLGTLQLAGSALQLVGGVAGWLTPEPTMLTKVGGTILIVHGVDSGQAAARQIWSGQPVKDLTQQAGEQVALRLGASPNSAEWAGVALDIAVPVGVASVVAAERILAVRAGRIALAEHEGAQLGHTIAKHVGKDEAFLRSRLLSEPKIPAATTFTSLAEAERLISDGLKANGPAITAWAQSAKVGAKQAFFFRVTRGITGNGVVRATGRLESMTGLRMVLKTTNQNGRIFFILTAYPEP